MKPESRATNDGPLRFSVVTCCYNQGQFMAENIESVLAQDYPAFEHIVVDDGSTDNTRAVCAGYPHVRYFYQPNAGQSAALNRGFLEAGGDVIAWLNSDDYYEPGAFHAAAAALRAGGGRPIVSGMARVVNAARAPLWILKDGPVPFVRLLLHPRLFRAGGRTVMPCQPSVFFLRAVREELGLLDTKLKYGMDYEYWLRALTRGYRFHYMPRILSNYRYHATSHTCQGYETFLCEWTEVSRRYYGQLAAPAKFAVECWWVWGAFESCLRRRHGRGRDLLEKYRAANPSAMPVSRRLRTVCDALATAPWLALPLGARVLRRGLSGPAPAAGQGAVTRGEGTSGHGL